MEYLVIGLIVLASAWFLFRYFRQTVKTGSCHDCARPCRRHSGPCNQDTRPPPTATGTKKD